MCVSIDPCNVLDSREAVKGTAGRTAWDAASWDRIVDGLGWIVMSVSETGAYISIQ